jgi:hypothetical protein
MTKVAARYWISNVGLKKRCKSMSIPTPPPGYWTKVAQGQKPRILPLPPSEIKGTEFVEVPTPLKRLNLPQLIDAADFKKELHPLVKESLRTIRESSSYSYGQYALEILVKSSDLDRAGKILSALFYAVERQGHRVSLTREDSDHWSSVLIVNGEFLNFSLSHTVQYRPNPALKPGTLGPKKVPVALLAFHFNTRRATHTGTTSWKDNRSASLEEQLNDVVGELIPLSETIRAHRLDEERKRNEIAEMARREEAAKDQMEMLKSDIDNLQFADGLRNYVERFRSFYQERGPSENLSAWITWALQVADSKDPFIARKEDPIKRYFKLHDQLWFVS